MVVLSSVFVGTLRNVLYVVSSSKSRTFLMSSSLLMTTVVFSLSAGRTRMSLRFLMLWMALISALVKLDLGGFADFKALVVNLLTSLACSGGRL